jgi:hypothetical protein
MQFNLRSRSDDADRPHESAADHAAKTSLFEVPLILFGHLKLDLSAIGYFNLGISANILLSSCARHPPPLMEQQRDCWRRYFRLH